MLLAIIAMDRLCGRKRAMNAMRERPGSAKMQRVWWAGIGVDVDMFTASGC